MMSARVHKTFTFINDEKLCAIIESARRHLIYAAPSIAESVANPFANLPAVTKLLLCA